MNIINFYLLKKTLKYILQNILIITLLILFINIIEISRLLESGEIKIGKLLLLSLFKVPTIISETTPFIIIISIAFMYKNLISNNELISMRNIGYSIIDIFKPVSLGIFIFGLLVLIIINPLSAKLENKFNEITSKKNQNIYAIKFIDNGMWIKNTFNQDNKKDINFINISNINFKNMMAKNIKIVNITNKDIKIIRSKKGKLKDGIFKLYNAKILNVSNDMETTVNEYNLNIKFNQKNIIDSISYYKHIPYYNYLEHVKNLKKFNLHSPQISLYYLSEILKPLFLVMVGFVVMVFSGQFKRGEGFFKVLFISVLIGFAIFLLKEIILSLTSRLDLNYIFSYMTIFLFPFMIGVYQMINIEKNN